MKYLAIWVFGVAIGALTVATLMAPTTVDKKVEPLDPAPPEDPPKLDLSTDEAIAAYSIGYDLSSELEAGLAQDGVVAADAAVLAGFGDGLSDRDPQVSPDEMARVMAALHNRVMKAMAVKLQDADPEFRKLCEEKLAASQKFLEAEAAREGVKKLEGGVLMETLKAAPEDAKSPTLDDFVVCRYTGSLIDGTPFSEASEGRVRVRDTTTGAQIALAKMKVGDHCRVVIPPDVAHGIAGKPPMIGPNEALVFDVELLAVESPDAAE